MKVFESAALRMGAGMAVWFVLSSAAAQGESRVRILLRSGESYTVSSFGSVTRYECGGKSTPGEPDYPGFAPGVDVSAIETPASPQREIVVRMAPGTAVDVSTDGMAVRLECEIDEGPGFPG